jgi:hypothetical protein
MAQSQQLGLFAQYLTVNSAANSVTIGSNTVVANGFSTSSNTFTVGTGTYFVANGNVGIGTNAPLRSLDVNGGIALTFSGGGARSINWIDSATGVGPVTVSASSGASPYLTFNTNVFGSAATERMRVAANGNIGIGNSTPATMLQISGSAAAGSDPTIILDNTTASTGRKYYIISGDGGPFRIYDATASLDRLRVAANGNIGIGNTTPAHLLSINDTLFVNTSITIGSSASNSVINTTSISTTTIVVSNVTQTQTNLQVDPAGTAVALAIALG